MTRLPVNIRALLLFLALCAAANVGAASRHDRAAGAPCEFTAAAPAGQGASGLIVVAELLLPEGSRPNQGVHIRFNGGLGLVGDFDAVRAALPKAAVFDCRGAAVLSPGFVNAHEHPAYSYEFPDPKLNPGYIHRDGWRLGTNGALQLPIPKPLRHEPGDQRSAAMLLAMELRHLLGGATAIAGPGGLPGVVRNINRHSRAGDIHLYDYEAAVEVFPFSFQAVEDLRDECAGGAAHQFPPPTATDLAFMAYVADERTENSDKQPIPIRDCYDICVCAAIEPEVLARIFNIIPLDARTRIARNLRDAPHDLHLRDKKPLITPTWAVPLPGIASQIGEAIAFGEVERLPVARPPEFGVSDNKESPHAAQGGASGPSL